MNTQTGDVYEGSEQIKAAVGRGEPVVEVSEDVADLIRVGRRLSGQDQTVQFAEPLLWNLHRLIDEYGAAGVYNALAHIVETRHAEADWPTGDDG